MADGDEFDHKFENLQRVLKLNAQYENHPYVGEFTKECSVMSFKKTRIKHILKLPRGFDTRIKEI